jgi:hypothetical protein
MEIPKPMYIDKKWNYSEERWKKVKDSNFKNHRETLKYFKSFVDDIATILKIPKENIYINHEKAYYASLKTKTQTYEIKHVEMCQSVESSKFGVYDWINEDIFKLSIVGEEGYISFNAYVIKRREHLKHLEFILT